jgi:hypothetical protein
MLWLRGSHPLRRCLPTPSPRASVVVAGPTTPASPKRCWFGLLPVRSPLLRESRLISVRRATEMFQFTHDPPSLPIYSAGGLQTSLWRGCPIRILRAHRLHAAPPERFAGLRVLLRSSAPRHPPRTLQSLCSCSFAGSLVGICVCLLASETKLPDFAGWVFARIRACVMHVGMLLACFC